MKKNKPTPNKSVDEKPQKSEDIFTKSEVEQLLSDLTTDLQRVQAEFINYKRRSEEEKLKAITLGKEQAVSALLPVVDSIDRAIIHEPDDIKGHQWVKGINSLASQLDKELEKIGLIKFGKPGQEFDPNLHEAVSMDDADGQLEVIAEVLQTGFMLSGHVIRPAMVRVTKK
jgi:molecular chaperone GrpE